MNKNYFEEIFKEVVGELRKKWGELNEDEIRITKGNAKELTKLIQKKFGLPKEDAEKDVSDILETFERKALPQKISNSIARPFGDEKGVLK